MVVAFILFVVEVNLSPRSGNHILETRKNFFCSSDKRSLFLFSTRSKHRLVLITVQIFIYDKKRMETARLHFP